MPYLVFLRSGRRRRGYLLLGCSSHQVILRHPVAASAKNQPGGKSAAGRTNNFITKTKQRPSGTPWNSGRCSATILFLKAMASITFWGSSPKIAKKMSVARASFSMACVSEIMEQSGMSDPWPEMESMIKPLRGVYQSTISHSDNKMQKNRKWPEINQYLDLCELLEIGDNLHCGWQ